LKDPLFTEAFV